jgi:hypothetical protein
MLGLLRKHRTTLVTGVVSWLLGSGVVWSVLNQRYARREDQREHITMVADLRGRTADLLAEGLRLRDKLDLLGLCKPSSVTYDIERRKSEIGEQAQVVADDLMNIEAGLAQLEKRAPRTFSVVPRAPTAPPNLTVDAPVVDVFPLRPQDHQALSLRMKPLAK